MPGVETVPMILAVLRVPSGERKHILDLARNAGEPSWLTMGTSGVSQQLAGVLESERAASEIKEWSAMPIPGLLQTADYSRAMLEAADFPADELDVRTMVRAGRGEVLLQRDPPVFKALISEAVVHEPIGSASVMSAQLKHLIEMSRRPNVTIRVVPLRMGWHPGWSGPFVVYEFAESPAVVHFEHYSSGAFVPGEHDVNEYRKAMAKMEYLAFSPSGSLDYLSVARKEWEAKT